MESNTEKPMEIFRNRNNVGGNNFQFRQPYNGNQMYNRNPSHQHQQSHFNQWGRGQGQHRFRGNSQRGNFKHRGPQNYRDNRFPRHVNTGYNKHQFADDGRNQSNPPRTEHSPWMTAEILTMIQEKDDMQSKAMASQNPDDLRIVKALRGRLNIAINDAKFFYNEKIKEAKNMKAQGKASALYCDPCDRAFPDENSFKEHKDEHITCKLDGCTFTAHPKIILKHIQMQHSNDMFFRVKGYDTPEEIQKWITERKSKFPTTENIEKKKAELLERKQRGETYGIRNERRPGRTNKFSLASKTKMERSHDKPKFNQKKRRNFKKNAWSEENTNGIASQNISNIVTLDTYYSNVEVNDIGELVGKKRIKWTNGKFENIEGSSDSESEVEQMQITDDEDENIQSNINLNRPLLLRRVDGPKVDISNNVSEGSNVSSKQTGIFGLVSYSSDSEVEENRVDSITSSKEDINIKDRRVYSAAENINSSIEEIPNINGSGILLPSITPKIDCLSSKSETDEAGQITGQSDICDTLSSKTMPDIDYQSDESGPEEIFQKLEGPVTFSDNNSRQDSTSAGFAIKKVGQKVDSKISKPSKSLHFNKPIQPSRRRIAFLERLLRNEINTERNYLMQACQYIEEHNFFDKPTESSETATEKTES